MAHYTLIARINAGDGKFPFVNVQFSKTHRPIPIEGATYYLRPSGGRRTPIRIGKDLTAAHSALLNAEDSKTPNHTAVMQTNRPLTFPDSGARKTVAQAAREYIERSKLKSRKTYIGYRNAVDLFVENCTKAYFDELRRHDMLDYLSFLRNCTSPKTGRPSGESRIGAEPEWFLGP